MSQDHRLQQQRFVIAPAAANSEASPATRGASQTGFDTSTKDRSGDAVKKRAVFDRKLQRYEAKYIIPASLACRIREHIQPFCEPDPFGKGDPPTYVITTLQLDSPSLALHYAKLWDFTNRFKLRVRAYGDPVGQFPVVFLEVKTKYRSMVVKLRSKIPFDQWGKHLFDDEIIRGINFKNSAEADNFYQFVRLTKEIGARPVVLIRYCRESYFGKMDSYSRVTFDRKLEYQQTYSWDSWGRDGQWRTLDNPMMQTRRHDKEVGFSGVVLEMKSLIDVPQWMMDVTTKFDLIRVGHCKYSNAMWAESMFRSTPWTPEYEIDLLRYL